MVTAALRNELLNCWNDEVDETMSHKQPAPDPSVVLSVQNLKKRIKNREIIKGISFEVYPNEVFGFLGPNGAGKTTTIRMLVNLIKPSEGTVRVCGLDIHKEHTEALKRVGCIVENPELYGYMSGWENLEHFARMLLGVGEERIREVTEIVGLEKRIHDKVKTYSLGMRQRLGIAQALLGRPQLLILDEPTNGLDPQGIKEMREFIRRLAQDGLSVFVSSHLLSEIQMMCDRVAIIDHGQIVAAGKVSQLLEKYGNRVHWHVGEVRKTAALFETAPGVTVMTEIAAEDKVSTDGSDGPGSIITQMAEERIARTNAMLVEAGVAVHGIERKNPTLEDLFLHLTEGGRIE